MFVSGLFKIAESKIVHSIEWCCQSIPLSNIYAKNVLSQTADIRPVLIRALLEIRDKMADEHAILFKMATLF